MRYAVSPGTRHLTWVAAERIRRDGDPRLYPAKPDGEADWLIVGVIPGSVHITAPVAPPKATNHRKCRPIGLYVASFGLAKIYDDETGEMEHD